MDKNKILVEVAYALPDQQLILPIHVEKGITVEQAIRISGILKKFPDINLNVNTVGIFGKPMALDATLDHLDRVEIYRALIADPKKARKERVEAEKIKK